MLYDKIQVEKVMGVIKNSLKDLSENFIPYQIDYTANFNKSFRRGFQSKYISDELGADEGAILFLIDLEPQISQTDIAKYLFKGKAHIGKMLNDMEMKGYIERVVDTKDNVMIKKSILTPKAQKYIKYAKEQSAIIGKCMEKEFSAKEIEQFISYLKRFRLVLASWVDVKLK